MKKVALVSLISIFIAITVLSGCSSNNTSENTSKVENTATNDASTNQTKTNDTAVTNETTTEQGVPEKYDPPIEMTTVGVNYPTVKFSEGESRTDNVWTRAYLDKFGIKLNYKWVVDDTQLEQKTNLMLSTGEIPDFMNVTDIQFKQLYDAGLIEDLTDVYEKYASESVKRMMTAGGPIAMDSAKFNGRLMGIPYTMSNKEVADVIFIRQDWMDKLGLPAPKSMQDVLAISEAFTTKDPDGNGKADTFGLAADKGMTMLNGFINGYHAYRDLWIKDSTGNLVYSDIQPEMRAALQALQGMYKSKQLDQEFSVKEFAKVSESLAASKVGILYYPPYGGSYPLQSVRDNNPSSDWTAYPLPSIDSTPAAPQVGASTNGYWVVKKGYEHPEAILKIMDFWIKTFYENKSREVMEKYVTTPDGNTPWLLSAIFSYEGFFNVDVQQDIKAVIEGSKKFDDINPIAQDTYTKVMNFVERKDEKFWGFDEVYGLHGARAITKEVYLANNLFTENQFYSTATQTMGVKMATLQKMRDVAFTKIITGAPIEEFDQFVESWNKSGGEQITKEVNDWYKSK
ncbi:extracellular solute-binding protein [Paenibacillus solisilvae]|uniref:Extracellular solute-binding protein n=1 Tax=Paenibacillus solisilvae TaxID=2486751 RepID=A0ABW0W6D8_9BACL